MQSSTNKNKRHKTLLFLNTQNTIVFLHFFFKIYMSWVNDSWFWRGPKLQSKGDPSLNFYFLLKIKHLKIIFLGPGGRAPTWVRPCPYLLSPKNENPKMQIFISMQQNYNYR